MIFRRMIVPAITMLLLASASGLARGEDYSVDASGASGPAGMAGEAGIAAGLTEGGGNGGGGGLGGNGDDGEDRSISIDAPVSGNVSVHSDGGDGGAGGAGGNGGTGGASNDPLFAGGDGGNGGVGGNGGNGGDGGSVDVTINQAVTGNVIISASGGAAGGAGSGGVGGDGGAGGAGDYAVQNGSAGGSGGNGVYGGDGGAGGNCEYTACQAGAGGAGGHGVLAAGTGGAGGDGGSEGSSGMVGADGIVLPTDTFTGEAGTAGAAGSISVVVNATIGGSLQLSAADIAVVINQGGEVGGTIAASGASRSVLTFHLDVSNPTDYATASALLAGNSSSGTIVVDGRTYAWSGFTELVNQLALLDVEVVTITVVPDRSASDWAGPGDPDYLNCTPHNVRAIRVAEGVRLLARRTDAVEGWFDVGTSTPTGIVVENRLGWDISVALDSRGRHFVVWDANGAEVGTCQL